MPTTKKTEEALLGWLSRRSQIPYSTLYQKVKRTPGSLTVDDLLTISDALDVPLTELVLS
jgi:hypothetical protein